MNYALRETKHTHEKQRLKKKIVWNFKTSNVQILCYDLNGWQQLLPYNNVYNNADVGIVSQFWSKALQKPR